jgi:hypothetical protein
MGMAAEADIVEIVWKAIQTHPHGALGLMEFSGKLAQASDRLEAYHRREALNDE